LGGGDQKIRNKKNGVSSTQSSQQIGREPIRKEKGSTKYLLLATGFNWAGRRE